MININDVKSGMTLNINNNIFNVIEFQHVKPGKGPAFVRLKLKNLRTGTTIDETFNTSVKFEVAHIDKKDMQFLYNEGDKYVFMNMEDFDQMEISKDILGNKVDYLKEGLEVVVSSYNSEIVEIALPDKVSLKVISTEPAVKGNTTSSAMKDATLETSYVVKVPIFIEEGEELLISTSDGKYSSRA